MSEAVVRKYLALNQPEYDDRTTTQQLNAMRKNNKLSLRPSGNMYYGLFPEYKEKSITSGFMTLSGEAVASFREIIYDVITDENGKKKTKIQKNINSVTADFLQEQWTCIATDRLFAWNGIFYDLRVTEYLPAIIEKLFRQYNLKYNPLISHEILQILHDRNLVSSEELNNYPDYIPFKNGHFNTKTQQMESNTTDRYFTYAFNYDYNPFASSKQFRRFMRTVIKNPAERKKVLLFLAYCLTNRIQLQKSQIWQGTEGSNGKTQLCELVAHIWQGLICQVPLQYLRDPLWSISLRGKLINIVPDLPKEPLQDEGPIKSAITDRTICGRDHYCAPTTFINTTKHIFSCNSIPLPPPEASAAFYRRWEIIHFTAVFKNPKDPDFNPTIHQVAIPDYVDVLKTEAAGILAYLTTFLRQVENLRVTDITRIKRDWRLYSDNVLQYYEECHHSDDSAADALVELKTPCSELYNAYLKWCTIKHLSSSSFKHFGTVVGNQGIEKKIGQADENGSRPWMYVGISPPAMVQTKISSRSRSDISEAKIADYLSQSPDGVDITEFIQWLSCVDLTWKDVSPLVLNNHVAIDGLTIRKS
jgi:phage/plasmid-associated DNA primase